MHYEVVFDCCEAGYRNWWFPMLGFGLAAVMFGFERVVEPRLPRFMRPRWRLPPIFIYGFIAFWIALTFSFTIYDFAHVCGALRGGRAIVVEGAVRDFLPGGESRKTETFKVGGRSYEYSQSEVQAGFNTVASQGGPIRDGLGVRIHDVDGQIARLEVLR